MSQNNSLLCGAAMVAAISLFSAVSQDPRPQPTKQDDVLTQIKKLSAFCDGFRTEIESMQGSMDAQRKDLAIRLVPVGGVVAYFGQWPARDSGVDLSEYE